MYMHGHHFSKGLCIPCMLRLVNTAGVMSEKNLMCKIAHFCTFLSAILTTIVRDIYVLTKYKPIDAKIAHSLTK